ncbi:hypothetical protein GDO78_013734 [Eleutherodactylus coqui]|uniref:Uncharacterized protein n=1 Tax=Eleutherodactylus coqui TaxID=57060 RepID=A0A8J6BLV0_ELECQ|nr:hypothetical protein GDO78_013734 [Eleutherodactylus coqui]
MKCNEKPLKMPPPSYLRACVLHAMFSLGSISIPKSFSHVLLLSPIPPILYVLSSVFLPRCRTLHFSLLNTILLVADHCSSFSRSF